MTTTELMIGNWVLDTRTNNPLQVNPFMAELEVPEWKEIELTEDILEQNGFRQSHHSTMHYIYQDIYGHFILIGLYSQSITITHDCKIILNVTLNQHISVHYLQNALKITGINKKIVL